MVYALHNIKCIVKYHRIFPYAWGCLWQSYYTEGPQSNRKIQFPHGHRSTANATGYSPPKCRYADRPSPPTSLKKVFVAAPGVGRDGAHLARHSAEDAEPRVQVLAELHD